MMLRYSRYTPLWNSFRRASDEQVNKGTQVNGSADYFASGCCCPPRENALCEICMKASQTSRLTL